MTDAPISRRRGGAEQRWLQALERQPELRELIEAPTRSRADIEAAASRLGIHISTIYRLLRRFAGPQTVEAITGQARGWRRGRSRLPAAVVEAIVAAIQAFFLTPEAPSMRPCIEKLRAVAGPTLCPFRRGRPSKGGFTNSAARWSRRDARGGERPRPRPCGPALCGSIGRMRSGKSTTHPQMS